MHNNDSQKNMNHFKKKKKSIKEIPKMIKLYICVGEITNKIIF